ncbi:PD-(D/E)XK nuclease family protein [Elongatibacter sediminis]|uniref:PD-(D/E)XK nuclease family protein n=1 Tax=Elongatibacter sediminis TaxID=3119006 RepID=UPI00339D59E5
MPNQRIRDRCLACEVGESGGAVRVTPPIHVLSQWVTDTLRRLALLEGEPVLARAGLLAMNIAWYEAVAAHGGPPDRAQRQVLARRARAADRELRHWFAEPQSAWLDADFRRWRAAAAESLAQAGQATPEDWLLRLIRWLESSEHEVAGLPAQVVLHGFLEVTGLEQRLLDGLQARGITIEHESVESSATAAPVARAFDDLQAELRAAAGWAREQHAAGRRHIAIVVNERDMLAAEVRQTFDRILGREDEVRAGADSSPREIPAHALSYHLPGGGRLAEQTVVSDALLLLGISLGGARRPLAFPRFSRLLLSPHTAGGSAERHGRALFEQQLRRDGHYRRSLHDLAHALRHASREGELPELQRLLSDLPALTALASAAGTTAGDPVSTDHAGAFLDCLKAWGWPGEVAAGSRAGEAAVRFVALLEELRAVRLPKASEALGWLDQICRETAITERGGPLSPVQVLSPEEAAGGRFDAAWVANVHADNWPGHPMANPWLPASATEHIPRASAAGELAYVRRLHAALGELAPHVVFSWGRQGGDAPRLPSPLVLDTCAVSAEEVTDAVANPSSVSAGPAPWPEYAAAAKVLSGYAGHPFLEAVEDEPGRGLAGAGGVDEVPRIPGSARMLQYQSACPLAAYLAFRLQVAFEPMPGPFADAAYRGQLMHGALEALFGEQAGRPGLPADSKIGDAVDQALGRFDAMQRLSRAGFAAERQRLCRLLAEWLDLERRRAGFTIEAVEVQHEFSYGGAGLRTRLDRVDRLDDGRLLIIDYKSGAVDSKRWADERLGEPQLPLYAVLLERAEPNGSGVGGLALASVRAGACTFSGVVDDAAAAGAGLAPMGQGRSLLVTRFGDWDTLRAHLESGITGLLDEIVAGRAENCLYDERAIGWAGLEPVLRHAEGAAWRSGHGESGGTGDD